MWKVKIVIIYSSDLQTVRRYYLLDFVNYNSNYSSIDLLTSP